MEISPNAKLLFAYPEESEKFHRRHPLWVERFGNLFTAITTGFTHVREMSEPVEKLVYFLGCRCVEDFMEILIVCGNAYGAAGMKLLRTMYEDTITLRYIHENPQEAEQFLDYYKVQQYKLMKPILETFGEAVLPKDEIERVGQEFEQVKKDFMVTNCEKCGTKRLNHTWNKLDFASMAKKTGAIGQLIVPGYFFPLRHTHPTFGGLTERLRMVEGRIEFQHESQPKMADNALMTAHNCLLNVLEVQKERFNITTLEDQIQVCVRDFRDIWIPDEPLPDEGPTDKPTTSI